MSLIGNIIDKIFHPSASAAKKAATQQGAEAVKEVDVVNVLASRAREHKESLNWQTLIVDLLKVLDLDSSLKARKELAKELGYTGDTKNTATMNMWLQKEVLKKLAQSGGKVPPELLHS